MGCIFTRSIGGCGCTTSGSQTFVVYGCNSLAYQGLTVGVYSGQGGSLLASGTTDATGSVFLTWSGASGSYWITVTGQSSRFEAYGATLTVGNGGSTTINLTPAAGYYCWAGSGCLQPLAATIHATDTLLGNATLTYQTSGTYIGEWVGFTNYSYAGQTTPSGGVYCASGTVQMLWTLGNVDWDCYAQGADCPANSGPYFGPSNCPTSSVNSALSQACPPAFSLTQTLTYNGVTNQDDPVLSIYTSNGTWQGTSPFYQYVWNVPSGTVVTTRTWTE